MQNLEMFEMPPKPLVNRVDLALGILKDGPEKGLFDTMVLAIRGNGRIMVFDLNSQDGYDTLALLELATEELRNMLPPKEERRRQGKEHE